MYIFWSSEKKHVERYSVFFRVLVSLFLFPVIYCNFFLHKNHKAFIFSPWLFPKVIRVELGGPNVIIFGRYSIGIVKA